MSTIAICYFLGVERYGKRWTTILHSFDFRPGRTAEDLKGKYRQLMVGLPAGWWERDKSILYPKCSLQDLFKN